MGLGLYVIFEGEVELWQEGEMNKIRISNLGKGEFLGLEDFQNSKVRSYSANALPTGCVLYFLQSTLACVLPIGKFIKHLDDKHIRTTIQRLFQQKETRRLLRVKEVSRCEQEMLSEEIKEQLKEVKTKDVLGEFVNT